MSIQQKVERSIARMKAGRIITYRDFEKLAPDSPDALPKVFQRLVERGTLVREKPGVFYKPRKTLFGVLRPSEDEILKLLLVGNDSYSGYLSGQDVFLKFRMSTQVPAVVTIASTGRPASTTLGRLRVRYVRCLVPSFRRDAIEKLQLLDCLRFMKSAQDTSPDIIARRTLEILAGWDAVALRQLCNLSLRYPPSTRSLLGALLELLSHESLSARLKASLNPRTRYRLGVSAGVVPNRDAWRIA